MQSDLITLSIIIPVYNVEDYLLKCLLSVISQADDRVQVILVDDGSTDKSIFSVQDVCAKHKNIELHRKNNGGLSSARNYGMSKAKGRYIHFVDSDDFICEGVLGKILDKLQDSNENCYVFNHLTTKQLSRDNYDRVQKNDYRKVETTDYLVHHSNPITNVWKMMVLRKFLIDNDISFREGVLCEDIEWLSKVLMASDSVIVSDTLLYIYNNQREDSIMNVLTAKRIINTADNIKLTKDMVDAIPENKKRKALKKLLFVEWCVNLASYSRLKKEDRKNIIFDDCFRHDNEMFIFRVYGTLIRMISLDILAALLYCYRILRAYMLRALKL